MTIFANHRYRAALNISARLLLLPVVLLNLSSSFAKGSSIKVKQADVDRLVNQALKPREVRPEAFTNEQIADFLSLGFTPFHDPANARRPGVIMWYGPMLVTLEDASGRDLDPAGNPGKYVSQYLSVLSRVIGLPISIVKSSEHRNNAAIVISDSRSKEVAGQVYTGSDTSSLGTKTSEILGQLYPSKENGETVAIGGLSLGYSRTACVLEVVFPKFLGPDPAELLNEVGVMMQSCLSPIGVTFGGEASEPLIYGEARENNLFFWKIFYNAGLTPGMDRETARQQVLQYLRTKSGKEGD